MTREEFWELIDTAQSDAAFDRRKLAAALRAQLEELDDGDALLDFVRHFHDCRIEAFRHELWAAAWILGGGASEDDFSDFRDWLITLGREAYEDALHDPERLLKHADPSDLADPFDPEIARVAPDLHTDLTGDAIPEGTLRPHPAHPTGRSWEPEDLPRRFPKLWRATND